MSMPQLTAGSGTIAVSWDALDGHNVTDYHLRHAEEGSGSWTDITEGIDGTSSTIAGLTNGTGYEVQVRAVNANGEGDWSPSATARPLATLPAAPAAPTLEAGNEQLTVTWTAPTDTGGSAISSYHLRHREDGKGSWTELTSGITSTNHVITGLTSGTSYEVQVRAVNASGESGAWSESATATPTASSTVPDAPTTPTLEAGNASLTVTWTAPDDDGGSEITGYELQYSSDGGTTWTLIEASEITGTSHTITDLTNGTRYHVQVRAVNAVGDGAWSNSATVLLLLFPNKIERLASDAAAGDQFGITVALDEDGDTAIVGAYKDSSNAGSAYVFTKDTTGNGWTQQAKLEASDAAAGDYFGITVDLDDDGTTAIVGAYFETNANGMNSGSAYVFTKDTTGNGWTQQAKLMATDGQPNDYFGISVAIDGDTAIVGAYWDDTDDTNTDDDDNDHGSAYIFTKDSSADGWDDGVNLTASDGAAISFFGTSVAIDGTTAVIGAPGSSLSTNSGVYIFTKGDSGWGNEVKLTPTDIDDLFGTSVAIDGDTVIVGESNGDDKGDASGTAYIFTKGDSGWGNEVKLTASDGQLNDYFGISVAIDGDTAIVGAFQDSTGTTEQGSAYIFTKDVSGNGWTQRQKLETDGAPANENFGYSVALNGDTAIVGARRTDDNTAGVDSGKIYIFTK